MENPKPALYLFPVGLSNTPAENVLPRHNLELLGGIRHFVVEELRTARRFLRSALPGFPIDQSTFYILNEHTSPLEVEEMLTPLRQGHPMGVLSEAGCPAVADPGADIVAAAQRLTLPVVPLVGPSSILLSLMASGFNGQRFAFEGYLPRDDQQRRKRLQQLLHRIQSENQTQIFIETPYRNRRLMEELTSSLPPSTMLCVASDITGEHESIVTKTIAHWKQSPLPDLAKIPAIFLLYK